MEKEKKPPTEAERQIEGDIPRSVSNKIRRAFCDGVSSVCLRDAWKRLDEYRKKKVVKRYFRGQWRDRQVVPLADIAEKLGRSAGEISRWFQNRSPDWGNLLMVMSTLDADWPSLRLPPKEERKFAGLRKALRFISDGVLEKSGHDFSEADLLCLEALWRDRRWGMVRLVPDLRLEAIARIAECADRPLDELDRVDRIWGDAYTYWPVTYGAAMDTNIWR